MGGRVGGEGAWGVLWGGGALRGVRVLFAAAPALLARRFGIDRRHDRQPLDPSMGLWLAPRPASLEALLAGEDSAADGNPLALMRTTRIGISQGQELSWRWYLRASRSVSRRARGDRAPSPPQAWTVGED